MIWKRVLEPLKERGDQARRAQQRLDDARAEYDRLHAELSHLEREIYEIWESDLPRSRKALLESAIRVRTRALEDRMCDLTHEMWWGGLGEIG